jgi:RNA polymerase sigma-70 factor (ECF subfamily)
MSHLTTLEPPIEVTAPALSSAAQDRLWITQTLAGEPYAFAHLIDKYKDQLFSLTCRVLKNRSQGEDILQDSFLQAYRNLKGFRYEARFSTWIYAIVLNRLRNHLRRNKIVQWSSLDAPVKTQDDEYIPEVQHQESSIEKIVESKLDVEAVQRIVATFPVTFQSIFILHYFQNMSLQEVSEKVGKPLGTVKVYLHRARKLLYKQLQKTKINLGSIALPIVCVGV